MWGFHLARGASNAKEADFRPVSRCRHVGTRIWSARGGEAELRFQVLRGSAGCRKTYSGRNSRNVVSDMQGASTDPE